QPPSLPLPIHLRHAIRDRLPINTQLQRTLHPEPLPRLLRQQRRSRILTRTTRLPINQSPLPLPPRALNPHVTASRFARPVRLTRPITAQLGRGPHRALPARSREGGTPLPPIPPNPNSVSRWSRGRSGSLPTTLLPRSPTIQPRFLLIQIPPPHNTLHYSSK